MPVRQIFLGRQPILDREQRIVAYELLFRDGEAAERAHVVDDTAATASVIQNAFAELGVAAALGPHRGYINVDARTLLSDAIELLPPDRVVLELLETVDVDAAVVERCKALKRKGYALALDDFVYAPRYDPLLELADVVKVDLTLYDPAGLEAVVALLARWPAKLLAEKVDSAADAARCRALGFAYFQGYFFARPAVLTGSRPRAGHCVVVELIALVLRDADSAEIEAAFKRHPELAFNLLRLVNSVAGGLARPLAGIGEALYALGRTPLRRWLHILLYTLDPDAPYPSPLLLLAAARGRAMESLAARRGRAPEFCDAAFSAGAFSLLDSLTGQPLGELVAELALERRLVDALLARGGELGELLSLVEATEGGDLSRTLERLKRAGLSLSELTVAQIDAMVWVNQLSETPQ